MACEKVLDFALHLICMKLATCGLWQSFSLCRGGNRDYYKKKKMQTEAESEKLKRNEKQPGRFSELPVRAAHPCNNK